MRRKQKKNQRPNTLSTTKTEQNRAQKAENNSESLPDRNADQRKTNERDLETAHVKKINLKVENKLENLPNQNVDQCSNIERISENAYVSKINLNRLTKARTSFLSNLCHVCKDVTATADIVCPKCQLIRYCSIEHRKTHWPTHAEICQAVQQLKSRDKIDHVFAKAVNLTPKEFREFRYNLLLDCQSIIERPLELWERESFLYPALCDSCHSPKIELSCDACSMISFCTQHADNLSSHKTDWCAVLKLHRDFIAHEKKSAIEIPFPVSYSNSYVSLPETVDEFLKSYDLNLNVYQHAQLTQISTAPLTILFGAENILDSPLEKRTELTIHLIGAEVEFELEPVAKWELFFQHLLPTLKTLKLVLIGPELFKSSEKYTQCSECATRNKTVNVIFESGVLYHEYVVGDRYIQPDIICIFNPGLSRLTGYNEQDSWSETISVMFQENVPVIMTAYTEFEIFSDLKRIEESASVNVLKAPRKNPYASQKPYRNFISDDCVPVIFKNYYLCVLSSQS